MDAVFKALNDPARRKLLDALRARDGQSLSELETVLEMTRFGVMKHLRVLEDAHLVIPRKVGRFKYHYLNAAPLEEITRRWIEPFFAAPVARHLIHLKTQLEGKTMTKPVFITQTYIRCTPQAIWDALNDPDQYAKWDFLGQTAKREGELTTYMMPDGTVTLQTRDVEVDEPRRLVTTFEPKWDDETQPSRVVYLIEQEGDFCKLTVEHHDLNNDPEGGTADGWHRSLAGLKTWLETGEVANFGGAYLWEEQEEGQ